MAGNINNDWVGFSPFSFITFVATNVKDQAIMQFLSMYILLDSK